MSEVSNMTKSFRAGIAGLAATAALLSACSPKHHAEAAPTIPSTAAPQTLPPETTTTATAPTTESYVESPGRNQRLAAAAKAFGEEVLAASTNPRNSWGPFDTFCAPNEGTAVGGWVSQGYKPVSGDGCYVQHNPQYHGSPDSVSATVLVGKDGKYTGNFIMATLNTPGCSEVTVSYDSRDKLWGSTYQASGKVVDAQSAPTIPSAQAVDAYALNCLAKVNFNS
jgi:hypothetical protein